MKQDDIEVIVGQSISGGVRLSELNSNAEMQGVAGPISLINTAGKT